jgi:hypothetical protein
VIRATTKRLGLVAGIVAIGAIAEAAPTLDVGPGRTYATIQAAVNALPRVAGAAAGYTILVHPGVYSESIHLPRGISGAPLNPVILKALWPARQPLSGSAWADTVAKRSVIDAGGRPFGIDGEWVWEGAKHLLIDGFYFTGAATSAIFLEVESDIWLRNNVADNTGANAGENHGGFVLQYVPNALIQNNRWELSAAGGASASNGFGHLGANGIIEYNECALTSGVTDRGRCFYLHGESDGLVFRYNFLRLHNRCNVWCVRVRDSIDQYIHSNYMYSRLQAQRGFVVQENTDTGRIERHRILRNTWLSEQGADDDYPVISLDWLNQTTVANNIFASMASDTTSRAAGVSYSNGAHSLTLTGNLWWNYQGFREAELCAPGCTINESGTLQANPGIAAGTGCATAIDNNLYGANLDVSRIPYRKCDGTAYPVATKLPAATPPAAPRNLRIVP